MTPSDATAQPVTPSVSRSRAGTLLHASAARLDTDAGAVAAILLLALLAFSPWWLGGRIQYIGYRPGTAGVRIAENWSEGWRYSVDGAPEREATPAADRSMIVRLAPRPEPVRVELRYRPERRRRGLLITWLAAAATLVAAPVLARSGRDRSPDRSPA